MPAYNFKPQFASVIRAGKKRQTIRAVGKRTARVGQTAYLYCGLRTGRGPALKLNEGPITRVRAITLDAEIHYVVLDGRQLIGDELVEFAKADGFQTLEEFFAFFVSVGRAKSFNGAVIYWEPRL